ncbi:hypothetical protein B0H16DRAFT_1694002 [Mycena metata]|uniref:Uncharacterized protein n=1 Tax=Mycena metata TaxID=1033252 RepID=A0AAD7N288_9AGAR|nr:hypothetical protein B0H16DRAFT_1694002 [Mycena metata]
MGNQDGWSGNFRLWVMLAVNLKCRRKYSAAADKNWLGGRKRTRDFTPAWGTIESPEIDQERFARTPRTLAQARQITLMPIGTLQRSKLRIKPLDRGFPLASSNIRGGGNRLIGSGRVPPASNAGPMGIKDFSNAHGFCHILMGMGGDICAIIPAIPRGLRRIPAYSDGNEQELQPTFSGFRSIPLQYCGIGWIP